MAVATRTDEEIKKNIVDELYWEDREIAGQIEAALERNVYVDPDR